MGKEIMKPELQGGIVDGISQRLSLLPDLYLPHALSSRGDSVTPLEKQSHLADLLGRDAALFLERYGSDLNSSELQEFNVFKEDYEIEWHLKQLKSMNNPTVEEKRAQAAVVKNRRLAFMSILMQGGQYFSEDAMRMRAPLLHHQYVGKFQDPSSRTFFLPGERWSDLLIRQVVEADYQARLKEEQEKAGLAGEEESEEEESAEEGNETAGSVLYKEECEDDDPERGLEEFKNEAATQNLETENQMTIHEDQDDLEWDSEGPNERMNDEDPVALGPCRLAIPDEVMQSKLDDFTKIMQQKFLSGEDTEHVDYSKIDHDTALDDHWLKEISQDAEDKYFDED